MYLIRVERVRVCSTVIRSRVVSIFCRKKKIYLIAFASDPRENFSYNFIVVTAGRSSWFTDMDSPKWITKTRCKECSEAIWTPQNGPYPDWSKFSSRPPETVSRKFTTRRSSRLFFFFFFTNLLHNGFDHFLISYHGLRVKSQTAININITAIKSHLLNVKILFVGD